MVETAADRAAFVADFGVSAVYNSTNITVLIQAKHDLSAGFELNGTELQTTDFIIEAPAEYLSGVKPQQTITVESVDYRIIAVEQDAMGWIELICEKA